MLRQGPPEPGDRAVGVERDARRGAPPGIRSRALLSRDLARAHERRERRQGGREPQGPGEPAEGQPRGHERVAHAARDVALLDRVRERGPARPDVGREEAARRARPARRSRSWALALRSVQAIGAEHRRRPRARSSSSSSIRSVGPPAPWFARWPPTGAATAEAPAASAPRSGSRATIHHAGDAGQQPARRSARAGDGRAGRLALEADLQSLEARHGVGASLATLGRIPSTSRPKERPVEDLRREGHPQRPAGRPRWRGEDDPPRGHAVHRRVDHAHGRRSRTATPSPTTTPTSSARASRSRWRWRRSSGRA